MVDVLQEPQHKLANMLFVSFNVLAILSLLGGIVELTLYLEATDNAPTGNFYRVIIACGLIMGTLFIVSLLAALDQILRYLASISSAVSHMALSWKASQP